MRTTVTLEPELAERLKNLAHRRRTSFKEILNEAIRRGLAAGDAARQEAPFVVEPHDGGFKPGVDPQRLNQLVDELEVEDFANQARRDP